MRGVIMAKAKKLSASRASGKCMSVQSKALPKRTEKKLSVASRIASDKISRNNQVYAASNSHASYYATK